MLEPFPGTILQHIEPMEITLPYMELLREAMQQHAKILEMHATLFNAACSFKITAIHPERKDT
jgi:hypothetical protein